MGCQFCKPDEKEQLLISVNKLNSQSTDEYFNYIKMVGQNYINQKIKDVESLLKNNELKKTENLIIDDTIKNSTQKIQIWAKFQDQKNSSYKIQNFYSEIDMLFTPEMYYLFSINELVTNQSHNAKYKILDYTINNNTAVMICHIKTKKWWLFEERNFVVVRIIKLLQDGSLKEFQQSISLNKFKNCHNFIEYSSKLKNLGTIHKSYMYYKNDSKNPKIYQYYSVDSLHSFSLKLATKFIKKKYLKFHEKLNNKIVNFVLTFREWFILIWFTTLRENFQRIFQQNLKIIISLKLDLKQFNQQSIKEFQKNDTSQKIQQIVHRRKNTDLYEIKELQKIEKEMFNRRTLDTIGLHKCKTDYHKIN